MSIDVGTCTAREMILITTRGSVYELIVLRGDQGQVLVRGGSHFPEFRAVRFTGSTAPNGVLRPRTLDIGLRMHFIGRDRIVITSAIQSLSRITASDTRASG